ncbi:cytochrome c biogenesis CcdA family protein [Marinithermus hydrothermalis]|uniref:Cytochrome c biogenesis protein transmembrane region n=1 Tax=Marinithermus hydrothermalis (strain DSM 14884 / JCM 11576 / T1) TaxID=869210 RepID=F2NLU6_MARHT|nr:cytochrome c biogenesis protein CcdA [Marinithermus hydrothermalis]AEB11203.1 cytochrome c biogenesis protein transmembrane region [Marinithermus hydrothermalis DSM 14884]
MTIGVTAAFLAGLFSFLSPCVLPLVPTYLMYLGGERGRPIVNAIFFILGFSLVFVALGLPFTLIGAVLKTYKPLLAQIGGGLVILFGLYLLGLRLPFMGREMRLRYEGNAARPGGAFLLGAAFGAGWTPCIGPILGAILTLTVVEASMGGAWLLVAYALGLAVPFMLVALFADRATRWVRRSARYTRWVERAAGVLMVFVGVLLVSGIFTRLNNYFIRLTPEWLWERL